MTLISEDEIREIQRIWRMENGDWQDTAYRMYEEIAGVRLDSDAGDVGSFGAAEQSILEDVCRRHNVPYKLVSSLLNAEMDLQGGSAHAKIFGRIHKELAKEWREDIGQIRKELFAHRDAEARAR